jgi:hypothetical protein
MISGKEFIAEVMVFSYSFAFSAAGDWCVVASSAAATTRARIIFFIGV